MPRVGIDPAHDTNKSLYIFTRFPNNDSLYYFLQKKIIERCISTRPIDQWNLLNNLDREFHLYNIKENDKARILMVALNLSKIDDTRFDLIDNKNYKISSNGLIIAKHLALFCLQPLSLLYRFLNIFSGLSHVLGGSSPNNS